LTPILALCLPQAPPSWSTIKPLVWTTYTRNFSPLALTVTEILLSKIKLRLSKTLTPSFGERVGAGRSKMEHNKVPLEDYLW